MPSILDRVGDREVRTFQSGEVVLRQGERSECLYVLIEGSVEVLKDDVPIAAASQPGGVFGELAVLLGSQHTATVRALKPCSFYRVDQPREFLKESPTVCFHLCELLARRIDALNQYLVDVKQQFSGDDHLGMVDEVLEALLHRQPRERVRPADSTLRQAESLD